MLDRKLSPRTRLLFLSVMTTFLLASCASKNKACLESSDQRASFGAPISSTDPVRMIIDTAFSASESDAITRAAETWNAYGRQSLGRTFFHVESGSAGKSDLPQKKEDQDFNTPDDGSFHVIRITDSAVWTSLGMASNNPAVTIRVTSGNDLVKQVVLVFLKPNDPITVQLTSVMVHEAGHTLGMDHSCTFETKDGYASCNGLAADHPYRQAVMFPQLRLGTEPYVSGPLNGVHPNPGVRSGSTSASSGTYIAPELKDNLRLNDEDRAKCLYQP